MNPRLQEIVNELARTRLLLLASVADLPQEDLDARPGPDQWSIGEILSHLRIIEGQVTQVLARQSAKARKNGAGPDPGTESVLHSLDRFAIEVVREKITTPAFSRPEGGGPKQELLDGLARSRRELLGEIDAAADLDLSQVSFPHPVFGRLTMYEWILFIAKHELRHKAQIESVKSSVRSKRRTP
jgi:uncharacterized damage-inducible protein DinB